MHRSSFYLLPSPSPFGLATLHFRFLSLAFRSSSFLQSSTEPTTKYVLLAGIWKITPKNKHAWKQTLHPNSRKEGVPRLHYHYYHGDLTNNTQKKEVSTNKAAKLLLGESSVWLPSSSSALFLGRPLEEFFIFFISLFAPWFKKEGSEGQIPFDFFLHSSHRKNRCMIVSVFSTPLARLRKKRRRSVL